jgi:hypothetical protein
MRLNINWHQIFLAQCQDCWWVCTILIPATIMTSTALTVSQVMGNAVEEVEVEGEKRSINKVYVRSSIVA